MAARLRPDDLGLPAGRGWLRFPSEGPQLPGAELEFALLLEVTPAGEEQRTFTTIGEAPIVGEFEVLA